jgi:hypothetical protein
MRIKKIMHDSWELVVHTCNPSYSGGRHQEDHGSKSAQTNSLKDPILKKPITKKGLVELVKALSSSPSTAKKERIMREAPIQCLLHYSTPIRSFCY